MPDGGPPIEDGAARRCLPRPQHPGGEDAVEERLHQGRMEETRSLLVLEPHSERLLQCRADGLERLRIALPLDPRETVAGVGRQQPGQVLRIRQRRFVRQGAGKVLAQARSKAPRRGPRRLQQPVEPRLGGGQPEGLQLHLVACRVPAHELELPQVGRQDQAIARPVAVHLLMHFTRTEGRLGRLHLHDPAFRNLPLARLALPNLLRRVEPHVGMARALVSELDDAEHLRLERPADGVQQVGERGIA